MSSNNVASDRLYHGECSSLGEALLLMKYQWEREAEVAEAISSQEYTELCLGNAKVLERTILAYEQRQRVLDMEFVEDAFPTILESVKTRGGRHNLDSLTSSLASAVQHGRYEGLAL